jgi:hypothetical protein
MTVLSNRPQAANGDPSATASWRQALHEAIELAMREDLQRCLARTKRNESVELESLSSRMMEKGLKVSVFGQAYRVGFMDYDALLAQLRSQLEQVREGK